MKAPIAPARLNDLCFVGGWGHGGDHARDAALAYLELSAGVRRVIHAAVPEAHRHGSAAASVERLEGDRSSGTCRARATRIEPPRRIGRLPILRRTASRPRSGTRATGDDRGSVGPALRAQAALMRRDRPGAQRRPRTSRGRGEAAASAGSRTRRATDTTRPTPSPRSRQGRSPRRPRLAASERFRGAQADGAARLRPERDETRRRWPAPDRRRAARRYEKPGDSSPEITRTTGCHSPRASRSIGFSSPSAGTGLWSQTGM